MSLLSVPNTFSSGSTITAAGHNQNYSAISAWAAGGIGEDNFATITGTVNFNVGSNALALSMINSGTEGVLSITNNGNLAAGKAVIKITQNNTGPALDITSTKAGILLPRMTTTQRDAISTPGEGLEIYNITLKRKEIYNGTYWVSSAGNSGMLVDWLAATLPPHLVLADGSTLASNGTNAYLISILGSTTLPNLSGLVTVGAGTYTDSVLGSTTRTLGTVLGAAAHLLLSSESGLPAHTHTQASHTHTTPSGPTGQVVSNSGASQFQLGGGAFFQNEPLNSATPVINANTAANASSSHNNMQPSYVTKKCLVL